MARKVKSGKDIPQEILDYFEIPKGAIEFTIEVIGQWPIKVTVAKHLENEDDNLT